ncbi:MAG: S1 RNA-binding domain-containing protein [Planctomycetaceae bacterium TMED241]|jgi:small subunit ribosomal protein S1|uniref:30S ribosomal protein S1 homolog B n=1 Tax=uncultured marine type-A Synechococcus GOM 3M9 TaxID=364149 RepID=Q0QKQ2_9SYNE|nr:S1 RNA-binding domain-containing protein [Synechococcus sp. KORDI-49]ABD96277.1 30S ribosomal protein S1 homolog B [uncultured marine type-A Synechococcus GOM 3M9]MBL6794979.1 S1 RNA-binding domain-containing protein [Synechococcus sp. BS307-5m-G34]OUW67064.1 MAG: 30S ribosomal protein S1 [Synechococcus sp. TMED205]RCL55068.1 MAG: S1 RNA-binding domain-containing protein [Synechococcus sp. MED-G70]RPG07175.1 MAG: S1 RNA-binding domain-containing protein [Planctomycetaceae bacterium TMED241]
MAEAGSPQPNRPSAPKPAADPNRKPPQVMQINRRQEQLQREAAEARAAAEAAAEKARKLEEAAGLASPPPRDQDPRRPEQSRAIPGEADEDRFDLGDMEGMTMADLLGAPDQERKKPQEERNIPRSVDDFDFDEEAFLAALDENAPVGTTGEVITGKVIGLESDGVYVDIGGKAPGFMPKSEAGLGVITNFRERFPKGLEVEVLVTREQNADGMVTISCRALALRKSWERVKEMEKQGKVVQVIVNGFNRGGVTCDLEGLRGFIPRSQLQDGENHQELVGKTLGVAFLEVNSETRKLVLSEKRAAVAARFSELEVGQLVEGQVAAVKPYGLFIDLGGISGLLHQSMITNGSLRSIREVFDQGDRVKAMITELDPGRGRIGLNTALLEGPPGELLVEKDKVMAEAADRASRAQNMLKKQEQDAG